MLSTSALLFSPYHYEAEIKLLVLKNLYKITYMDSLITQTLSAPTVIVPQTLSSPTVIVPQTLSGPTVIVPQTLSGPTVIFS